MKRKPSAPGRPVTVYTVQWPSLSYQFETLIEREIGEISNGNELIINCCSLLTPRLKFLIQDKVFRLCPKKKVFVGKICNFLLGLH
jgi:hypothetical protein